MQPCHLPQLIAERKIGGLLQCLLRDNSNGIGGLIQRQRGAVGRNDNSFRICRERQGDGARLIGQKTFRLRSISGNFEHQSGRA